MKYLSLLMIVLPAFLIAQTPLKIDDCLQLKGVVKKNTNIYADPNSSSHERALAEKFSIVYMFSHEGTSQPLKNGFYRVGKTQEAPSGYIHKDDVVQWNHRLCLAFTDLVGAARTPALIYGSLEDAQEEDWDSNKKPNSKARAQEPTDNKSEKYDMLLPVLEETVVEKKGRSRDRMKAYKIGFLGETGSGSSVKRTYKGKSKLDLMFLIDATASMKEEIDGAKEVVRSLIKSMRTMENTEVRMGISLYKDYNEDFVTRKWQGLTTDYSRVLSRLSDVTVSDGGDHEEAMFQGVETTINATNWSKGEETPVLREILIIGDAPGKEYAKGSPYDVDQDDLITKASMERVRFIAMNVGSDAKLGSQMKDFRDGLRDGDQGLYVEVNATVDAMSDDYLRKLSGTIRTEIERLKELESVRSGDKSIEDVTPINRAIFMKNLPSSGFDDIGIHFNTGWITQNNSSGLRQVQPYVYMTYSELNIYKFYCESAIAVARQPSSSDRGIVKLAKDKLSALTGEAYDEGTEISDHLNKALCLPSSDSGLLSFSLDEIFRWSEKRKERFIESIEDRVNALDALLRDTDIWRKPSGSDLKYTFVKLELMP